jgi:hypothetical protein
MPRDYDFEFRKEKTAVQVNQKLLRKVGSSVGEVLFSVLLRKLKEIVLFVQAFAQRAKQIHASLTILG